MSDFDFERLKGMQDAEQYKKDKYFIDTNKLYLSKDPAEERPFKVLRHNDVAVIGRFVVNLKYCSEWRAELLNEFSNIDDLLVLSNDLETISLESFKKNYHIPIFDRSHLIPTLF